MLSLFGQEKRLELLNKFIEKESLFRCLDDIMNQCDKTHGKITCKIENWYDAKAFVQRIMQSKLPHSFVNIQIKELRESMESSSSDKREDLSFGFMTITTLSYSEQQLETGIVLVYAIAIIYSMCKQNDGLKYEALLKEMCGAVPPIMGNCLSEVTDAVKKGIDEGEIVFDYDYVNNKPFGCDEDEDDNDEEEEDDITEDEDDAEEEDEDSEQDPANTGSSLQLRVRIEALLSLMDIEDPDTVPCKKALCRLFSAILKVDDKTIYKTLYRRYSKTNKRYTMNKKDHGEDINVYNNLIDKTKIEELKKFKLQL